MDEKAQNINTSPEEKETLSKAYKQRGFQQQSLNDYLALKKQQEQRKNFKIPMPIKVILSTPLILFSCLGLIFIPFMIYLFFTSLK